MKGFAQFYEKINVELNKLYDMYNQPIVVMGELLIKGIDNRAVSNGIFNRDVINESIVDDIFILIWDVIPFISWSSKSYKEDYIQRFESIENSGISQITLEDVEQLDLKVLSSGKENWKNGLDKTEILESLQRHLIKLFANT